MKKIFILLLMVLSCASPWAQVIAINNDGSAPHASALVDVRSTTKGILIPRMTTTQMNAIVLPAKGLMVYNTTLNQLWVNRGTPTSPSMQPLPSNSWLRSGNSGTVIPTNFIGTTSNDNLEFITNNIFSGQINPTNRNLFFGLSAGDAVISGTGNVGVGASALISISSARKMVAIGDSALYYTGTSNNDWTVAVGAKAGFLSTQGALNTYIGYSAGYGNIYGNDNVAFGANAMYTSDQNYRMVAIGAGALQHATGFIDSVVVIGDTAVYQGTHSGNQCVVVGHKAMRDGAVNYQQIFIGYEAGLSASNGGQNIGIGYRTMSNSQNSEFNIAIGHQAMEDVGDASENVAIGDQALQDLTTGRSNIAVGERAGWNMTTGNYNVAIGSRALRSNITADRNIAIGDSTLYDLENGGGENMVIGTRAGISSTTANNCVFIGSEAASSNTSGDDNVALGHRTMRTTTSSEGIVAAGRTAGDAFNSGHNCTYMGSLSNANAAGYANSIALGYSSTITASNQVRIGTTTTTSIGGYQTWSNLSDGRFKSHVQEDVPGLELIKRLSPVTYQLDVAQLNQDLGILHDATLPITPSRQTGLIAQDVLETTQALGYDFSGIDLPKNNSDMFGLRYAEFVVPLVKAVQEQQAQIDRLKAETVILLQELEQIENRSHSLRQ